MDTNGKTKPKRRRRSPKDIQELWDAIAAVLETDPPMTVRQVYYRMAVAGVVDKTDGGYRTVMAQLLAMRRAGRIPYEFIADATRWVRRACTYDSVEDALLSTAKAYRRGLWADQGCEVEVWVEKGALAGVLDDVTDPLDVSLLPCGGNPSETFVYEAAMQIIARGVPTHIYYFGDHDPSGRQNADNISEKLAKRFGAEDMITFEVMAVTREQIDAWDLPTNPSKPSDPRNKKYKGPSVQLDAVPVDKLKALAEECIFRHLDPGAHLRLQEIEQQERETLLAFAESWAGR